LEYVLLGNTGLRVSRLCFGTLTIGPLQKNLGIEEGASLLKSAREAGVTFFDTAELYGTYPHLKKAFAGDPDVVISTKSYSYDEKGAKESLKKALRGLGRDRIDIFMLHEQQSGHTLRGHWGAAEYFLSMKQRGVIRAFGISTHHAGCVLAAAKIPEIDVIHMIYNIRGLGVADGTRDDMENAVRAAHRAGKGIFAMKPLGGGHLFKSAKEALAYAADSPHVHSVAVGMQNERELAENCAFFSGARDTAFSEKPGRSVMVHGWCAGCGKCAAACAGGAITIAAGKARVDMERCVFCGYCAAACPEFAIKVV